MVRLSFRSLVVFGTFGSLLGLAPPAQAQMCPGSHLLYIVRDANGTPVDAAAKSFTFKGSAEKSWYTGLGESYDSFASRMPTELLRALRGTINPLGAAGYCTFTQPVSLSVTMSGKTMDLTFNVLQCCNDSRNFLVDGLPFQEGRFEITLAVDPGPVPVNERSNFYPAKGWIKK